MSSTQNVPGQIVRVGKGRVNGGHGLTHSGRTRNSFMGVITPWRSGNKEENDFLIHPSLSLGSPSTFDKDWTTP